MKTHSTESMMRRLLAEGWELRILRGEPNEYVWIARRGTTTIRSTRKEVLRDHCVRAAYRRAFGLDEVSA